MNKLLKKFDEYLFKEVSAVPVVILRIGFGLIFLLHYLTVLPNFETIFSTQHLGGVAFDLPEAISFLYTPSLILLFLGAIGMIIGLFTNFSIFIVLLIHSFFLLTSPTNFWGWGFMIRHYLIFLLFTSSGRFFSLDARRKNKILPLKEWKVSALPIRFIQVQICLVYLISSWNRLDSPEWKEGYALVLALNHGVFTRLNYGDFFNLQKLFSGISVITFYIEWIASGLILYGRYAKYLALILISLHLTLELTTTIQYWQHVMILTLLFFLPDKWILSALKPFIKTKIEAFKPNYQILKPKTSLKIIFISYIILGLMDGYPKHLAPNWYPPVANAVQKILMIPTLIHNRDMFMFKRPVPEQRLCYFVLGYTKDGKTDLIENSNINYCLTDKLRFFHDEYYTFIYRSHVRGIKDPILKKNYSRRFGKYYCSKGEYEQISWGQFRQRYKKGKSNRYRMDTFGNPFIRKKLKPVLNWNCKSHTLAKYNPEKVYYNLKKNHPEYFKFFKDYNYGIITNQK